ncbi:MerR family transcriptional regulator [Nocardia sp. CDC160]|uniref:MerR family transcriptional regulator n=1 Tax=Nocardia sp. CDC160 TaxID=3112166 RepID=UPI002DB7FC96|nr:MerR family transcriptional regulator [Nocardia sp. CDC160]MEC3916744.1 MerR family transcriptional regulator [Nocardia sp. CDC160]
MTVKTIRFYSDKGIVPPTCHSPVGYRLYDVDALARLELLRTSMPDLPEDPTPEQVQAWMELVQLVRDSDFRLVVRRMAEYQERQRAQGDDTGLHHDLTEAVRDQVGQALAAGTAPASPEAATIWPRAGRSNTFQRIGIRLFRAREVGRPGGAGMVGGTG